MAQITISHRIKGTEAEIRACGVERLRALYSQLEAGLALVATSAAEKFPHLSVSWDKFDPEAVDYDEYDAGEWDAVYFIYVEAKSPFGNPVNNLLVDAYDRWEELGEPLYQQVSEALSEADWSLIKPFCDASDFSGVGDMVLVEFDAIKAVHSYRHDGLHFYYEQSWL